MTLKPAFSKIEEPEYQILSKENNIEIRQYNKMIIAETVLYASRKEAVKQGFRILADYIFGANEQKLKIAMTAPVKQKIAKVRFNLVAQEKWQISFVMPSKFQFADLPKTNNKAITLKEIAAKKYLVIKFNGLASVNKLNDQLTTLLNYSKKNKLKTTEIVIFAFYNPPWTLPFSRRNEIMLELSSN